MMTRRYLLTPILASVGLTVSLSFLGEPVAAAPPAKQPFPRSGLQAADRPDRVPGEVLVRFKAAVDAGGRNRCHDQAGAEVLSELPQLRVVRVRSRWGEPTEVLMRRYADSPAIEYAEPNWLYYLQLTPNDAQFAQQWDLNNTGQAGGTPGADVRALQAWDRTTGSSGVVVAVIDTGIDASHPDLAGNVLPGKNFLDNSTNVTDESGHGTHVAGTIAAVGNNGIGVAGLAWSTKILPLKIAHQPIQGTTVDVAAAAIMYAADNGAKISNNSYVGPYSQTVENAIIYANGKGMLVIAAAGNDGVDITTTGAGTQAYPCSSVQPNVICVAATDRQDLLASFVTTTCCSTYPSCPYPGSNYGPAIVHLGAPGKDIVSTWSDGTYQTKCGTSTAAPHVAGAAALLLAYHPTMSAAQLKSTILATVDPLPALAGKTITGGRLNIAKALQSVYQGYHDGATCQTINGWAWDHTNTPTSVDIYNGTSLLGTSLANLFRSDLLNAGIGNGYHAFVYNTPQVLKDGVTHSIRAKFAGTVTDLSTTPKSLICNVSVFTTQLPVHNVVVSNYENAMQWSSSLNGNVSAIRFYKWPGETCCHVGRLWSDTGTLLGTATFTTETASGWQEQALSSPVTITAGTKYRVSYNENVTHSKTDCGLSSPISNGPLTGITSFYTTPAGIFPTTPSCSNFFIDVRFNQ
jgi:subtilisin family serine protease